MEEERLTASHRAAKSRTSSFDELLTGLGWKTCSTTEMSIDSRLAGAKKIWLSQYRRSEKVQKAWRKGNWTGCDAFVISNQEFTCKIRYIFCQT